MILSFSVGVVRAYSLAAAGIRHAHTHEALREKFIGKAFNARVLNCSARRGVSVKESRSDALCMPHRR
jgi:hypothetical protein